MRRFLRLLFLTLLVVSGLAQAATPVAVWDGDFTGADATAGKTCGSYAIKANGNTVAADGSYIQISANVGVLLDWPAPSTPNDFSANGNITILVKYSNWSAGSSNGAMGTLWAGGDGSNNKDIVGPWTAAGTGILANIWNGTADSRGTKEDKVPVASGRFSFDFSGDVSPKGSTTYICSGDSVFTEACSGNGILFTSTKNIYGAAVGGSRNAYNNLAAQTGMRIEAVAIFNARLTTEELDDYVFPSDRYTGRVVSINIANALNDGGGWVDTSSDTAIATIAGDIPGKGWQNVGDTTDSGARRQGSKTGINAWTGSSTETLADLTFAWNCGDANMGALYSSVNTSIPFLKCYYSRANQTGLALQKMTFTGIPYAEYDAIVYLSGTQATANQSVTFNDVAYYGDTNSSADYKTVQGSSTSWGAFATPTALTYGGNVLRVDGFDSTTLEVKVPESSAKWGIASIQLVERVTKTYRATVDANTNFSELTWTPAKPAEGFPENANLAIDTTTVATLRMDEAVNVRGIQFSGAAALTVGITANAINAAVDVSGSTGGVTIDASGLDVNELVKYAVAGAPHSHWLVRGRVTGAPSVLCPAAMPADYTASSDTLANFGVRVVVTAADSVKFGSISVNLSGDGFEVAQDAVLNGAHPIAGTGWNNFRPNVATTVTELKQVGAGGEVSTESISFQNHTAKEYDTKQSALAILRGYHDDNGANAEFTFANIPYNKYRLIVYFATDSANIGFAGMVAGASSSSVKSYFGPTYQATGVGYTIDGVSSFANTLWGNSNTRGTLVEGVNYIVTDVIHGGGAYVKSVRNGNGRGTIAAIQVLKLREGGTDYSMTMNADVSASTAVWTPTKTAAFTSDDRLTITNMATRATFTADEDITVGRLKIVSEAGKMWVFKKEAGVATDFGSLDFSEAVDGVGYDCTDGFTACDLLLDYARTHNEKFTFFGEGENGALIDYGTTENNYTFGGHHIFEGGTHTFQNCSESANLLFGENATAENPTFWVKDGTTLNFKSHNPCGWSAVASTAGIVRIGSGATVAAQNSAAGTWYWSQQFYFENNSTLAIETAGNNFRVVGGDVEGAPQFYMPSAGSATITGLADNSFCLPNDEGSGVAFEIGADATLTVSAKMTTLADGKPLVKRGAGTLSLTGDLSAFNAAYSVLGGTLMFAPGAGIVENVNIVTNGGEIAVGGEGAVIFRNYRGKVTVTGTAKAGYTVGVNDIGRFKIPSGMSATDIRLYDAMSGSEVPFTVSGDWLEFDWQITDGACWWDYEFNGNVTSTGTDTTTMTAEGPGPYYNAESNALWVGHATPYRGATYPAEFSAVMYGKVVDHEKHVELGFGTVNNSEATRFGVGLACGDPTQNEVLLLITRGATVIETVSMKVPSAYEANHLYAFVCKTVVEDANEKTRLSVYLDGKLLQSYTFAAKLRVSDGFQIGSMYGGVMTGYAKATTANINSFLDFLRTYKAVLTDEAMAEYAKRYPYVSANGKATRTFADPVASWTQDDAWTQTPCQGDPYPTNHPSAKSMVAISATVESEVTFDLYEAANYESLDVLAGSPITLRTGGSAKPAVAGFTTVGTDLTVDYDAIALGGPVSVLANKTLTFDFRSLDVSNQWTSVTNVLTGMVTLGEGAQVVSANLSQAPGRTVEFVQNASTGQYELRITLNGELSADLSGAMAFGDLVWKVGEEIVSPDWTKTVVGTIHVLTDDAALTFARALASTGSRLMFNGNKAVTLSADGGVTGISYDFTGLEENKVTFTFDPDPVAVVAVRHIRYDVDMGTYNHAVVLRIANALYEFKKIRIDGSNYDYHDRTVIVQTGDYLNLHDGSNLGCGLSLDVRGGTVHLGTLAGNSSISYGRNGTRFNQSGGTVTVHANGEGQASGTKSGFVIAHTFNGGGFGEFNITGGLLTVPESSICFNQPTNTINVSGAGVLRAKGAYYSGDAKSVAGTVNVTNGGTFEVGSLGVTATAMKSLTLNGGTLRGYEDGASFASAITLGGKSTIETVNGTSLTLSGGVVGFGTIKIAQGIVKLGKDEGLGAVPVSVETGATLDLNGFMSGNAVMVSGSGANGDGALVNTGSREAGFGDLLLTGDTTIGGTDAITNRIGSAIGLGGYALTIDGNGAFSCILNDAAVSGGGTVRIKGGSLKPRGQLDLGDADMVVGAVGKLDLSSGTFVLCRNFVSEGNVLGSAATLVVSGMFNASAPTEVAKLRLSYGATLKGTGLRVSSMLELQEFLVVEADEERAKQQLATVPDGSEYSTAVKLNGKEGYIIRRSGTSLRVVKDDVITAHVDVDVVSGTNFESLHVEGVVDDWGGSGRAHGNTNVYVVAVSESTGAAVTQKVDYVAGSTGTKGTFEAEIEGVDAGDTYTISAFVHIDGGETEARSRQADVVAARSIEHTPYGSDGWIYENWKTFAGVDPGTGIWYGTNGVACVDNKVISLFAEDWTRNAEFQPTNMTLDLEYSYVKDLHFHVMFDCPGFYSYESYPIVQDGVSAAFTLVADDEDNCSFAVVSGGEWEIVPRDVIAPELGVFYDVLVRLDGVASNIQYSVISGDSVTRLATCPVVEAKDISLDLAGSGDVKLIEGIGQNAHLAQVGDEQYQTIGEAIEVSGNTGGAVVPLWWSRYLVGGDGGAFRLRDPNGYLELIWRKWHHWGIEDGVYRWISGNNWIEYADKAGVVEGNDGGWLVTNEFGLAWIAEQATNQWFCGDVSVSTNLDLSSKNWTPIAQFVGSFDGRGFTIKGLNNSHVIYTNLLGAAGYYFGGPSNDWDYAAYGLFGSATNATFANVTFEDVAISNVADSAAVLLGVHAGGTLAISNVTVASGRVQGEGRAVAGILTVGGNGESVGDIVVANATNRATIAGSIFNDADGGNVAQILAGTTWGTEFDGDVVVTNVVGEGEFDVSVTDGMATEDWYDSYFSWFDLPVCNFAAAVMRFTEEDGFRRFVEANDPASIPIDPVYRTARMLAGSFANGADNVAGWWMDTISAMKTGGHLWITGELVTNDTWQTVTVDRSVSFDLRGNTICTVYDDTTFRITHDACLSVSNGTILVPEGGQAFGCVGASSVVSNDVNIVYVPGDFYDRTVIVDNDTFATMDMFLGMLNYLPSGTTIEMDADTGLVVDPESNALIYEGKRIATLAGCRSIAPASSSDGAVTYVLELNDKAVPDFGLEVKSAPASDGTVAISLSGTHAGFYYAVQHKSSLVEKDWTDASEWKYVETDGEPVSFALPAEDAAGFYRVKVTDRNPVAD